MISKLFKKSCLSEQLVKVLKVNKSKEVRRDKRQNFHFVPDFKKLAGIKSQSGKTDFYTVPIIVYTITVIK